MSIILKILERTILVLEDFNLKITNSLSELLDTMEWIIIFLVSVFLWKKNKIDYSYELIAAKRH